MEPLAERLRPKTLDEYIGQEHLVGEGAVLRNMIESGHISSFILWGPPGVGKTTLAQIIANKLDRQFCALAMRMQNVHLHITEFPKVEAVVENKKRLRPYCLLTRYTASPSRSKTPCWVQWSGAL